MCVGDTINLHDGIYNCIYYIAGFDCEHNRLAADGTVYDNGYGIALVPYYPYLPTNVWNKQASSTGGYKGSTANTSILPTIATNLKNNTLGSHLVNRNVLLSSSSDGNGHSTGWSWTNAELTLMSAGQTNGVFRLNSSIYDDGEATYKLPIFNYATYVPYGNFMYWLRGHGGGGSQNRAHVVTLEGHYDQETVTNSYYYRPLFYIR